MTAPGSECVSNWTSNRTEQVCSYNNNHNTNNTYDLHPTLETLAHRATSNKRHTPHNNENVTVTANTLDCDIWNSICDIHF